MQEWLDIAEVARLLELRFGIGLNPGIETVDGGIFHSIRPVDLELGNGFSILLARTPREIEAVFHADNFAAGLLRRMWDSDSQSRQTFHSILAAARADEAKVYFAVDGNKADFLPDSSEAWRSVDIEVRKRMPARMISDSYVHQSVVFTVSICLSLALALLPIETVIDSSTGSESGLPEGAKMRVEVNRFERSPANRASCIAHFGPVCQACGFQFSAVYGALGEGFVEVHHRTPVSQVNPNYFVNPIQDLVPLCSNCHSMVHRENPPIEMETLRAIIIHSNYEL